MLLRRRRIRNIYKKIKIFKVYLIKIKIICCRWMMMMINIELFYYIFYIDII
jgi:hypothetical protein